MDNYPTMDLYVARIIRIIGILFICISAGGFIYFRSPEGAILAAGAAITCIHNGLKIFWLKNSVERATQIDPNLSVNYIRGQGMLRMLFTIAVLVGAGFLSGIEALGMPFLVGAIAGLLTQPIANYSMAFFAKKDYAPQNNSEPTDEGVNTDV